MVIKPDAVRASEVPVSVPCVAAAHRRPPAEGPRGLLVGPVPGRPWGQQGVCSGMGTVQSQRGKVTPGQSWVTIQKSIILSC